MAQETADHLYLIDASRSMTSSASLSDARGSKFDLVRRSLKEMLATLARFGYDDQRHRVGVLAYKTLGLRGAPEIIELIPLYPSPPMLPVYTLDEVHPMGGSPLGEALKRAIIMLDGSLRPRKRIVLLTDGGADSKPDPLTLLGELRSRKIHVDVAQVGGRQPSALLEHLANETGGRFIRVQSLAELREILTPH